MGEIKLNGNSPDAWWFFRYISSNISSLLLNNLKELILLKYRKHPKFGDCRLGLNESVRERS